MNRSFSIFIILLILTSCLSKKSKFDQNGGIQKLGIPSKVEYYKHIEGKAFQYSDTATFVINDHQELESVIDEIKNADNPEPWKGVEWDRIKVYFIDTVLTINTNNKKIGTSASGTFYDLEKDNFITKRISKKQEAKR